MLHCEALRVHVFFPVESIFRSSVCIRSRGQPELNEILTHPSAPVISSVHNFVIYHNPKWGQTAQLCEKVRFWSQNPIHLHNFLKYQFGSVIIGLRSFWPIPHRIVKHILKSGRITLMFLLVSIVRVWFMHEHYILLMHFYLW